MFDFRLISDYYIKMLVVHLQNSICFIKYVKQYLFLKEYFLLTKNTCCFVLISILFLKMLTF